MRGASAAVLAAHLLFASACATGSGADGTLDVYAAASLTEVFTELGRGFERAHGDVRVRFSFAGSPSLARQVADGAPADVLVAADETTLDPLVAAGDLRPPRAVARNRLSLLVPAGNPRGITSLADLDRPGVSFVHCAPRVPCGALAVRALAGAGVAAAPRSLEANVKAVAARVLLGEADAGLVYETDVLAAGPRGEGIGITADPGAATVYSAAVVASSRAATHAAAWIGYLLGPHGRRTFVRFGFLAP